MYYIEWSCGVFLMCLYCIIYILDYMINSLKMLAKCVYEQLSRGDSKGEHVHLQMQCSNPWWYSAWPRGPWRRQLSYSASWKRASSLDALLYWASSRRPRRVPRIIIILLYTVSLRYYLNYYIIFIILIYTIIYNILYSYTRLIYVQYLSTRTYRHIVYN